MIKDLQEVLTDAGNKWDELNAGYQWSSNEAERMKVMFCFGYLQSAYKMLYDKIVTDMPINAKHFQNKKTTQS